MSLEFQEMLGLALVASGGAPADAATAFKEAFLRYSGAATGGAQFQFFGLVYQGLNMLEAYLTVTI